MVSNQCQPCLPSTANYMVVHQSAEMLVLPVCPLCSRDCDLFPSEMKEVALKVRSQLSLPQSLMRWEEGWKTDSKISILPVLTRVMRCPCCIWRRSCCSVPPVGGGCSPGMLGRCNTREQHGVLPCYLYKQVSAASQPLHPELLYFSGDLCSSPHPQCQPAGCLCAPSPSQP